MLVIVELIVLLGATVGVLSNAGAAPPADQFLVSGYDLTGSTATVFLFGIAVGAVASLALGLLLTLPRPAASREVASRSIRLNSVQALPN